MLTPSVVLLIPGTSGGVRCLVYLIVTANFMDFG